MTSTINSFTPPAGTISERLLHERDHIMSVWLERTRKAISSTQGEKEPILVDTLPAIIENLAEALAPNYPRKLATEGTTVATEHGGERARVTRIVPAELIREYQILRDVIFEVLYRDGIVPDHERVTIVQSIDQAMAESLTAFFLVHEALRERFSITLAHDLRNPLSAIASATELLLRSMSRPEQVAIIAARIAENAKRIDRMIRDLLDASRVRFGEKLSFEVEPFELLSLIQEIVDDFSTVYGNRFVVTGKPVHGYWNREIFRRAIENLLTNALKHGDPVASIQIKLETVRGRVILSVHNEGPHIPAEAQERLFHSFMRALSPKAGGKTGWGLGLTMVRGMAEGHGGSITVDSAPGRGVTFVVDVPADSRPYLGKPRTPGSAAA